MGAPGLGFRVEARVWGVGLRTSGLGRQWSFD